MANTFGKDHDDVRFYLDCYNREVQGLDDVEIWIHTCWGNPNMQRVIENDSYAASLEMYMNEARGDVWTIETKDRDMREVELLAPFMKRAGKKVCVGAVSHRRLQVESPEDVAGTIRITGTNALRFGGTGSGDYTGSISSQTSDQVDVANNLNLASGKVLKMNGTKLLNSAPSTGWTVSAYTVLYSIDPATITHADLARVVATMIDANKSHGFYAA
jgi:hypothetical protein